jgi:hypothetical protein
VRRQQRNTGGGEWVTQEQEKGSRGVMDVIQTVQCSTICSSCGSLVKIVFQHICLVSCTGSPEAEAPRPWEPRRPSRRDGAD